MDKPIAMARPEEVAEYDQWMKNFSEEVFSYDLNSDPGLAELANVSKTRIGTFMMWKKFTKGTLG